ncbi:MAG: 5-formyltetrahydrofolate cyclo-ligase [Gammaproteobacteria bacterium]
MTATLAVCSETKTTLRRRILRQRQQLGSAFRARASARIRDKIRALPAFVNASSVLAFSPTAEEVDIRPLFDNGKKKLALPRIGSFARREMSLHWVDDYASLIAGPRGIMEPPADAPLAKPAELDFWLIPALAADNQKRRLGYGGGFYDTLLSAAADRPEVVVCAAVFGCQMVNQIPEMPHDRRADIIITEEDQ